MTSTKAKKISSNGAGKVLTFRPGPYAKLPGVNPQQPPAQAEYAQAWKETVDELKSDHFSNVEQAIEAIVDKVMKRLHVVGDDEEIRDFLYKLLEMDPEIVKGIEQSLQIGSS